MKFIPTAAIAAFCALALTDMAHAATTVTMQCAPNQSVQSQYPSGTTYSAGGDGLVFSVNDNDVQDLEQAGCQMVGQTGYTLIAYLKGANMNVTTDQKMTMLIPVGQNYTPAQMYVTNCSTSLTTAAGAVYDAASKTGNILFGTTLTTYAGCTGAGTAGPAAATTAGTKVVDPQTTPPILSLTTAQGAAATADIYIWGYVGLL